MSEKKYVINPLTGRQIQVGKELFNQRIWDAYDYINGELIRRESAPLISPISSGALHRSRDYYRNILTGRKVDINSKRYKELIKKRWVLEEEVIFLIPPWMDRKFFVNEKKEKNGD